jgi:hypothetical protein
LARPTSGTLTGAGWTNTTGTAYIKTFTSVLATIDIGNGNAGTGVVQLQEATPGIAMASADITSANTGVSAVGATVLSVTTNGDRGPGTYSYSATF